MSKNESVEFFLRFLRERFDVFRAALLNFLQALSQDDRARKIETAKATLVAIDDLKRALSAKDHPLWIATLQNKIGWYIKAVNAGHADAGLQLLQTVMTLHPEIENQTWDFTDSAANAAIDFSTIYQEYYRESRVPELFDELVAELESIITTGEIDSLQAINALEKLISTIKKNSKGDFFSTRGTWEFTQLFFKNYALELLESVPGLKQAIKSLRKTLSELDLEFSQVHEQIRARLTETVKADLPMLEYHQIELPAPESENTEKAS